MSLILNCCGGSGSSGSGGGGVTNHELLTSIMGGDSSGHYHVTANQFQRLSTLLDDNNWDNLLDLLRGDDVFDGGFPYTPASDYTDTLEGGGVNDSGDLVDGGDI